MPSLDELAIAHGTDKSSKFHNYVSIYEALFEPLRHSVRVVLEIGVGGSVYRGDIGASLRMWADYFDQADIYGIDIDPVCEQVAAERVHVRLGSQADPAFLNRICDEMAGPPDIIIDDGSHINELTVRSFEYLFPRLRPGGWYILEDMHVSYDKNWTGNTFDHKASGKKRKKWWSGNRRKVLDRLLIELIHSMDLRGEYLAPDVVQDFAKIPASRLPELTAYERWVGELHLYQGLYAIKKRQ